MDGTIWPPAASGEALGKATEGMTDYDANSAPQRRLVEGQGKRLRDLVERIGVLPPEFKIVDYGCGPGRSALEAVRPAVEAYREMTPDGRIAVCHADQPGNDWNALLGLAEGPLGYGTGDPALRTELSVGSFYEPMAAPGSVALGTCFTSIHWLSRAVRMYAPGVVWFGDLEGAARAELASVADADLTTFLRHRARELRRGGYLLLGGLGAVPDPDEVGGVAATARGLYRAIGEVLEAMADDGLLDRSALDRFMFPNWFHTAADLRRPIERERDLGKAFEIVELQVVEDTNGSYPIERNPSPEAIGEYFAGVVRGFADSTLSEGLFLPSAKEGAQAVADEFYRLLAGLLGDRFAATGGFEAWNHTLVLRRR